MMVGVKKLLDSLTTVIASMGLLAAIPSLSGCGGGDGGDDSVSGLIRQLGADDEDTHLRAAWALKQMKAKAIGPLADALRGADRRLARRAGGVLASIGEGAVGALTEAMADKEFNWPHIAAAALVQIGPPSRAAVDTLLAALKDGDAGGRTMAAYALGRVKLEADTVIPALLNALRDGDDNVREVAANSLGSFGQVAIEPMIAALSDSRVRRKRHVALVLARYGPAAGKAADGLLAMLKGGDDDARGVAVHVLGKIEAKGAAVQTALIAALSDAREHVSETAARLLGKIGAPAVEALIEALGDKDVRRPGYVALALSIIGPPARGATDRLLALLKTGDEDARGLAAFALGKVADGTPKVISALSDALQNDPGEYTVQVYAAEALGRITPPARAARGALTEALKHSNEAVRKAAAAALESIKAAKQAGE